MGYTQMWEITDNNGTIHSGTEDEMRDAFSAMEYQSVNSIKENMGITKSRAKELKDKYVCEWSGDLRLIQIHNLI